MYFKYEMLFDDLYISLHAVNRYIERVTKVYYADTIERIKTAIDRKRWYQVNNHLWVIETDLFYALVTRSKNIVPVPYTLRTIYAKGKVLVRFERIVLIAKINYFTNKLETEEISGSKDKIRRKRRNLKKHIARLEKELHALRN